MLASLRIRSRPTGAFQTCASTLFRTQRALEFWSQCWLRLAESRSHPTSPAACPVLARELVLEERLLPPSGKIKLYAPGFR
jgi:hypothetical protein